MSINADTLRAAYKEAGKLSGFLEKFSQPRAQYNIPKGDIERLFREKSLWEGLGKGGHDKRKNVVTEVVVGWQAHGGSKVEPAQANRIAECVQAHLDKVKDLFGGSLDNPDPDCDAALQRYNLLHPQPSSGSKKRKH